MTQNNNKAKELADSAELHTLDVKGRATDITAQKVGLKTGREVERAIKAHYD